jgi:hypothetical protein
VFQPGGKRSREDNRKQDQTRTCAQSGVKIEHCSRCPRSVDQARIRVRGWAAEIGGSGSPITILGFVNGAKVLTVQTRGERPDVAAALNLSIFAAKDVSFDGTLTCRRGQQLVIVAVTASNKYVLHPHRLFCP